MEELRPLADARGSVHTQHRAVTVRSRQGIVAQAEACATSASKLLIYRVGHASACPPREREKGCTQNIVAYCESRDAGGYTPSDFERVEEPCPSGPI
jgi:hypothetical protein